MQLCAAFDFIISHKLNVNHNHKLHANGHSKFNNMYSILSNDKLYSKNNTQQIKGPDSQFALLLFFFRPFRFMANALTLIIIIGGGVHLF